MILAFFSLLCWFYFIVILYVKLVVTVFVPVVSDSLIHGQSYTLLSILHFACALLHL